jgi:single-stranded DNA-specific DHH superfamily exonuclease
MKLIEKTLKPALEFFKEIENLKKGLIICGHDLDTICSTVILLDLLKKLKKDVKFYVSKFNFKVSKDCINHIKKTKPQFVLIPDVSTIEVEDLNELIKFSKVLIIDHHEVKEYYKKVFYSNPRIFDKDIYIPVSYLCYKLYQKFFESEKIAIIAGIGTLSDRGIECCLDLYKKLKKLKWIESLETIYTSKLFLAIKILAYFLIESKNFKFCVKFLLRNKNLEIIFKHPKILPSFEKIKKEVKRLLEEFERKKVEIGEFKIFKIESKYRLASLIANLLAKKEKGAVIVYQKEGKYWKASLRKNESKIDLNEFVKLIAKRIRAEGGGHPVAAAISKIRSEKEFLNEVKKLVEHRNPTL